MARADLNTIVLMEAEIFSDCWSRQSFEEILEHEAWQAIVAEHEGRIIGYACWMISVNEAHLANIAVDPAFRRKSVARRLLGHILKAVGERDCEYLLLEVRQSNEAAIVFYVGHGFELLYRRPGYYRHPVEDALVMVYYLKRPASKQ